MSNISRQQLKKNELADFVVKAAAWIQGNRQTFFAGLGAAAGAVLLAIFFVARYQTAQVRANDKLSMAEAYLYQQNVSQGVTLINELIRQYPRTPAASRARIELAEFLMGQKKFPEAQDAVRIVADSGRPAAVRPLALELLGAVQEEAAQYDSALQTYLSFIEKYPEHFLAPKVYESVARVYELTNAPAEARSTYEKIVTLYPASRWAQRAQERISALGGSPQPPAASQPLMPPAPGAER